MSSAHISKQSKIIAILDDQNCFCCYPQPLIANFDNSSEFSFEFLELLHCYGVTPKPTTVKNPQTNAFVERVHQVIGDAIRSMELHTKNCDDVTINAVLKNVAYGLRATYHSSIAASPGQLVFGRNMVINSIYLANWKNLATRRQTQIHHNNVSKNKSCISHDYNINDLVYIHKSAVEQTPFEFVAP